MQLLLDSFDLSTLLGIRDFAIVMLVSRLGLRSIEVARMELRDLDCSSEQLSPRSGRHVRTVMALRGRHWSGTRSRSGPGSVPTAPGKAARR